MLKPLNFNTRKSKLFVCTDTHFNHDKEFVIGARGYQTVSQHDNQQVQKWNDRVGPNDNVLFLGDFILNDGKGLYADSILDRLNGTIYMLWGNHNSGVKVLYRKAIIEQFGESAKDLEIYPVRYKNVVFLGDQVYGFINGTPYVASHFPFHIWNEMQHGAIALSGHSHGSDEKSQPDCLDCRRLDCGIDNFGHPITFEEVMEIMAKKKVQVVDHHDQNTVSGR